MITNERMKLLFAHGGRVPVVGADLRANDPFGRSQVSV